MISVTLDAPDDFDGWRNAVKRLIGAGVDPAQLCWHVAGEVGDLFGAVAEPVGGEARLAVPKAFIPLARAAILHSDPERFVLLHTLLADIIARTRRLDDRADPLVVRIEGLAKNVRRDIHKMRAFVRFRKVDEGDRYVAWFEPDHHIVRANATFFIDRFASMHWSILTPAVSIHWDGKRLSEGPGAVRGDAPDGDPVEDAWKRYYASIFNPARLKVGAMMKEMPRKYWHNMPETALIGELVAGAQARSAAMISAGTPLPQAGEVKADTLDAWAVLRSEAHRCKRCPLFGDATQMVWGQGPLDAPLMLVGEQPGDQEDVSGNPFVGPAGQILDGALEEAGIDRQAIYLTNAVKHFKFVQQGKRRLHQSPTAGEIDACRWWMDRERALIRPRMTLALGASAARSLFGKTMPVARSRGMLLTAADGGAARITVHPSYLLRLPDADMAESVRRHFVADLRAAWEDANPPS